MYSQSWFISKYSFCQRRQSNLDDYGYINHLNLQNLLYKQNKIKQMRYSVHNGIALANNAIVTQGYFDQFTLTTLGMDRKNNYN